MKKYNETLANRLSQKLMHLPNVEEKEMFGGLLFMVNGKMCIGVKKNEIMVRINPADAEKIADLDGWRPMIHGDRIAKSFVFVSEDVINQNDELDFWLKLALDFNPIAKASKKNTKR